FSPPRAPPSRRPREETQVQAGLRPRARAREARGLSRRRAPRALAGRNPCGMRGRRLCRWQRNDRAASRRAARRRPPPDKRRVARGQLDRGPWLSPLPVGKQAQFIAPGTLGVKGVDQLRSVVTVTLDPQPARSVSLWRSP